MTIRRRDELTMVLVLVSTGCADATSDGDGDGAGGQAATTVNGSSTVSSSASASSGSGQATSPAECEALAGADCQAAGCIGGEGFRFPEGVAACQVDALSCADAEPITRCIYDEPNTAYLFQPMLIHRVVGQRTEVVLIGGRPIFGSIPAWTIACPEHPECPGFDQAASE